MNKALKSVLIGLGILIAVLVIAMGGFYFKMKSELKKLTVINTKEVVQNIYSVKDNFVNMFLIRDSDNYVAIDVGANIKTIENQLDTLGINPEDVTVVMLTHTDGDHVAALPLFKNAKVYLSKDEEQMINGKIAKMMNFHNKISTTNYNLLDDQQTITVGNLRIKGIATPGHTPGSMSYLVNDKYLFVGDAFGIKNGKIEKPNSFFSKDMKTAIKTIDKINNLPEAEYIFTAHTGYSDNYRNAVKTELK